MGIIAANAKGAEQCKSQPYVNSMDIQEEYIFDISLKVSDLSTLYKV